MSITIVLITIVMLSLFPSCGKGKNYTGEAITERDSMPVMITRGVTTLISDSGVTKYRIITEEWKIFDRTSPSYWAFLEGIYLENFDSLFNVESYIQADTAYYYDQQRLWELIGNVEIINQDSVKFNTQLLYWDQEKEKVYSNKYIRIEEPDRIISGYGFESNQQMTRYRILNMDGIFYVEEEKEFTPNDSIG